MLLMVGCSSEILERKQVVSLQMLSYRQLGGNLASLNKSQEVIEP